jgi:hypothetical protein
MRVRSLLNIGIVGISLAVVAGPCLAQPALRQDPPPLAGWGQPGSALAPTDVSRYLSDHHYRPRFGGASRDLEPYSRQQFTLVGWGQSGSLAPPNETVMGPNQNIAFKRD